MTLLGFLIAEIEWNSALDAYVLASHCYVSHQLLAFCFCSRSHTSCRNAKPQQNKEERHEERYRV